MKRVSGDEFSFPQLVEALFECLLLEENHGREVQVFTKFIRGFLKLWMIHAIEFFLDAYDLLHDFDAFVVLAIFGQHLAFVVELSQLFTKH